MGNIEWVECKNLINFIFALQSQSADNYVSLLLSKEQIKELIMKVIFLKL